MKINVTEYVEDKCTLCRRFYNTFDIYSDQAVEFVLMMRFHSSLGIVVNRVLEWSYVSMVVIMDGIDEN